MKNPKKLNSDFRFAILLTACYLAGTIFVLLNHEMWRDELEPWMIAKYSSALSDLFVNMRYEGHPVLWYLVIYALSRLATAPELMQFANLLFCAASVFLIAKFSPMAKPFKVLFAFGFYPFYQYAIISRGYALCMFILFVFCALYHLRRTRLIVVALLLVLLSNSDVYGWFYCASLSVGLVVGWLVDRRTDKAWRASTLELIASAGLILAGMLVSAKLSAPPPDGGWFKEWYFISWIRLASLPYSFAFDLNYGPRAIYILPTAVLLTWFTLAMWKKPAAFASWVTFLCALAAFYYSKFLPAYWHKGMLLIFIIACLWLSYGEPSRTLRRPNLDKATTWASNTLMGFLILVLAFYTLYACKWIAQDLAHPYSTSRAAAAYIKQQSLQNSIIVGDEDFVAQGVSAYLDKPIHYPVSRSMGRYVVWNNKRKWPVGIAELFKQVYSLRESAAGSMLLVLNYPPRPGAWVSLSVDPVPRVRTVFSWEPKPGEWHLRSYQLGSRACQEIHAKLLKQFSGSVKIEENLWIYAVEKTKDRGNL